LTTRLSSGSPRKFPIFSIGTTVGYPVPIRSIRREGTERVCGDSRGSTWPRAVRCCCSASSSSTSSSTSSLKPLGSICPASAPRRNPYDRKIKGRRVCGHRNSKMETRGRKKEFRHRPPQSNPGLVLQRVSNYLNKKYIGLTRLEWGYARIFRTGPRGGPDRPQHRDRGRAQHPCLTV